MVQNKSGSEAKRNVLLFWRVDFIDTLEFAHRCCGRLWKTAGWVMLALSAIAMALLLGRDIGTVGFWGGILCAVQCVALILSIFPVEAALKKKFDEFGLPKERPNQ